MISPFGDPFDGYFTKIFKPAIEECGLFAVRGDSLFRPTTIVDDIWTQVQAASVLIAELTGRNANVFYELGLAHALSKPVILLTHDIDDVPFDLRGIRILQYDKNEPDWGQLLRADLVRSLNEVLASPTLAIPTTFKKIVTTSPPEESEVLARIETLEAAVRSLSASSEPQVASEQFPIRPVVRRTKRPTYPNAPVLLVGQRVNHRLFGPGEVLEIDGAEGDQRAKVNFDSVGLKWLQQSVANMQPLQD